MLIRNLIVINQPQHLVLITLVKDDFIVISVDNTCADTNIFVLKANVT